MTIYVCERERGREREREREKRERSTKAYKFLILCTRYRNYYNILKRYLFHLALYLKQSTLFPGKFIQIESEPTENDVLSEISTTLRGILSNINTSLRGNLSNINTSLRGNLSLLQRLSSRNLTCLCLQFLKKKKLAKRERANICRDRTGTTGLRIPRLTAWTTCELTNAGRKRSLKSFQWPHAWTTGTRTAVASTRYADMRRKISEQNIKTHKLMS